MHIQTLYRTADTGQQDYRFAIESRHGRYVASVDRLHVMMEPIPPTDPLDRVTLWHPVPRWMSLTEAVNTLIP